MASIIWSARQESNLRVTALEVPCLIHLGHWRPLVELGAANSITLLIQPSLFQLTRESIWRS